MIQDKEPVQQVAERHAHSWLGKFNLAYVPGPAADEVQEVVQELLDVFQGNGHQILADPRDGADILVTDAKFGSPLNWRNSLLLTARRRYKLEHTPLVFTLIRVTPKEFQSTLKHFEVALAKEPLDPQDFAFPGLTDRAFHTLYEQGKRGGPILSTLRLLQSQALCVRIILIVGEDQPVEAYTFDLVGAYPRSDASDRQAFYTDLMNRILTAASTHEITDHRIDESNIPQETWQSLRTPDQMRRAGLELANRNFFTEMVSVENLVSVPAVGDAIAEQYSEGCYATWDPQLDALVTTITGSARPVDKGNLSDNELAVISGVRQDGRGAIVRHVNDKQNDPPSSEAVEMYLIDQALPRIQLGEEWQYQVDVPVARSKLHGHRGVRAYHPKYVEHVFLGSSYYDYPVSCSTEAQAHAIQAAFARSEALQKPQDPRQVVFTVLPGHGVVIIEKWIPGKEPFQVIWEYMDQGLLQVDRLVPQGRLQFTPDSNGLLTVLNLT